jgi:hypothetical protein
MDAFRQTTLRTQLLDRRQRLEDAISPQKENRDLERLLLEVDSALKRIDNGSYGLASYMSQRRGWLRVILWSAFVYPTSHLSSAL